MSDTSPTFVCPMFGVETKVAACGKLQELVWMGKRPEVRRGCQACMDSSKCPMVALTQLNSVQYKTGTMIDIRNGKLPREVLERIRPIVVQDQHLMRRSTSAAEREAISGANDRIDQMLKTAPGASLFTRPKADTSRKAEPRVTRKAESAPAPTPEVESVVNRAAATGDMSAAINQATA